MSKNALILGLICITHVSCSSNSDLFRWNRSGYYNGDRPPSNHPVDISKIPEPLPRMEPLSTNGNLPYRALGKKYSPLKSAYPFYQTGVASWYGTKFHGRRTSSGEIYDMYKLTAAHPILPIPSYVRVIHLLNGKSIIVRVNDRGPFLHNRIIDLSYAAAHRLGIAEKGTGPVEIEAVRPTYTGYLASIPNSHNQVIDKIKASKVGYLTNYQPKPVVRTHANDSIKNSKSIRNNDPTKKWRYFIQVGAFTSVDNARRLSNQLIRKGYTVSQRSIAKRSSKMHLVQVGPYKELAKAEHFRRQLKLLLDTEVAIKVVPTS